MKIGRSADPLRRVSRPCGKRDRDERKADAPGSQTASSCTETVEQPGKRRKQEPLGNRPQWKYPSIEPNVKRGREMAASQVMGTGKPQGHSDEASNDRGAKVTHAMVARERETLRLSRS
jgi:hypothetical protein